MRIFRNVVEIEARRREMHDDGRAEIQGPSLAGSTLINESIHGKSRSSSNQPRSVATQK